MREIIVLNIEETLQILAEHGMKITAAHLRAGLDCKAYPFGVSIPMAKRCVYEVYKPLLLSWIEERSEAA